MLLSYTELCELVDRGVITNVKPEMINATSIDVTLGSNWILESVVDDVRSYNSRYSPLDRKLEQGAFFICPGQVVLAETQQVFNLPLDISCEFKLKSSAARFGLDHALAGWCDAGWNGSVLTLEIRNSLQYNTIQLCEGDAIGQMVFFRHAPVPYEKSYAARGRYNRAGTVESTK